MFLFVNCFAVEVGRSSRHASDPGRPRVQDISRPRQSYEIQERLAGSSELLLLGLDILDVRLKVVARDFQDRVDLDREPVGGCQVVEARLHTLSPGAPGADHAGARHHSRSWCRFQEPDRWVIRPHVSWELHHQGGQEDDPPEVVVVRTMKPGAGAREVFVPPGTALGRVVELDLVGRPEGPGALLDLEKEINHI